MAGRTFEIWSGSTRLMDIEGGYMLAHFWGTSEGETFKDACAAFAARDASFAQYFDQANMTHWGCALFDNESQARDDERRFREQYEMAYAR